MSAPDDRQAFHERVQALFLAALERPEGDRARFVAAGCGGDQALRREVESLLRHHRPDRTLLPDGAGTRLFVHPVAPVPGWARPRRVLLAALLGLTAAGALGLVVHQRLQDAVRHSLRDHVQGVLNAGVVGLEVWMHDVVAVASAAAAAPNVVTRVEALVRDAPQPAPDAEALVAELASLLETAQAGFGWIAWGLVDFDSATVVAYVGPHDLELPPAGSRLSEDGRAVLDRLLASGARMRPPHPLGSTLQGDAGDGRPVLTPAAVVRGADGRPVAAFFMVVPPDATFTRILSEARPAEGGETIAFDREGRLLCHSIHEPQLQAAGVVGAEGAMLKLVLRDPGVDLLAGQRPSGTLDSRPLTRMAEAACAGQTGFDLDGYRTYTGVEVIGAWTWLPDWDLGVATEIPVEHAFAPLAPTRTALGWLWTLAALAGAAVLTTTIAIARLSRRAQEIAELGQYRLVRLIGEGGMGRVYLARHALLVRPAAVKVLPPDRVSPGLVARFEQEVQQTALLEHPNTIEIHDYGRTAEGVFYYAMEYVEGLTLQRLVEIEGRLPAGRVVHLLRQVCASLAEAHARGLAHRDVKPQNVLVGVRGGLADFVKVLDFGLVCDVREVRLDDGPAAAPGGLLGTPPYMAPERLAGRNAGDARGDVYAVGALAFKLLTGREPFEGRTPGELAAAVGERAVPRPSECGAADVPAELERLVLACLAKDPRERPADAGAVRDALLALPDPAPWTQVQAAEWWRRRGERGC